MPEIAPYGSWVSPISAADVARGGVRLGFPSLVAGDVWWLEGRPTEQGRQVVVSAQRGDLLGPPWNARTRVHEYGGRSFWPIAADSFVFSEWTDQRLYLVTGEGDPRPLTPAPAVPSGWRYADATVGPDGQVWCVRETVTAAGASDVVREIVAVPLDGSAADDPRRIRVVVGGSRFFAYPTVSPDGGRLAWVAWEHPQMPWDGTELRIGALRNGIVETWTTLAGGPAESILQPTWAADGSLYFLSDRSGWWNLYRWDGAAVHTLAPRDEEFGGPLWQLGMRWFAPLADGRIAVIHGGRLGVLDPDSGEVVDVAIPLSYVDASVTADGSEVVVVGASPTHPLSVARVDVSTGRYAVVRRSLDTLPPEEYLPVPVTRIFRSDDGHDVHAHVYPPRNPVFRAPDGERPPYIVVAHGGPTASSPPIFRLEYAYFTSRGIGILDVDYGGSSGYGRAYRERLRGQWGVVDVADCVTAVRALAASGEADPDRVAIRGGSAGGWTVLCAVTRTDVFAAGTSYFGVADPEQLAAETHDFESHYLDGLLGPLPEARDVYRERAPIHHVDAVRCPVLLLQGAQDPIVPPSQAELFRDALAAKGIPHAYLLFEGEQHGFRQAENIVRALEAELSFYGQLFGFSPPGIPVLPLTPAPPAP
ncbi:MAG: prolyl oligopeptidase family serine peptidase [Acidothermus cellulolyticus]|nr:prolyl oligopeptidase family serine peptidase [Acidothermus cellulolyticus]